MINDELLNLNIEFLKMNLAGRAKTLSDKSGKKGFKLEDCFRLYIPQAKNGGNCLEDLENNSTLFNYSKEKRKFDVQMVGFTEVKNKGEPEPKDINLAQYKCYEPEKSLINLNYEGTYIEYDLESMQVKQEEMISLDIMDALHDVARKNSNQYSECHNFFEKVQKIIKTEKIDLDTNYKIKITENELTKYLNYGKAFLKKIKDEFNSAQKGYPTLKRFSKLKTATNLQKDNKDIFVFHATFRRELDAAFKVKHNYDFAKFSGLEEIHLNNSEENEIFKENDILLFELKDSNFKNLVATYINKNYYVLNSHIELIKKKENFKDCRFFYVGIQEQKIENVSNNFINNKINRVYDELREKEGKGIVKIKLFEFINDTIFHVDLKCVNAEKLQVLSLLKDELDEIKKNKIITDNKIDSVEGKIDSVEKRIGTFENQFNVLKNKFIMVGNEVRDLKNIILIMLAVIICLISFLIIILFKKL